METLMSNVQQTTTQAAGCTPCQQVAMARMTIPQRLAFMQQLGLTEQLKTLQDSLAASNYQLPTPSAIS